MTISYMMYLVWLKHGDYLHDENCTEVHLNHLNDVHGMVIAWWSLTWYTLYRGKHDDHLHDAYSNKHDDHLHDEHCTEESMMITYMMHTVQK